MNLPKQHARKLVPRELKIKGVHPVFHSSLLRVHVPNDDRLFPGRDSGQVTGLSENSNEWAVSSIETHSGKGENAMFKVIWKAGDHTWLPFEKIRHLEALKAYLEAEGASAVEQLTIGKGIVALDDPQVALNSAHVINELVPDELPILVCPHELP